MSNQEQEKKRVGIAAVEYIQSGMVVGLGTGSTALYAIQELGRRVREGLSVQVIPTSKQTKQLAENENIPLIDFSQTTQIDLTIDGADEINPQLDMIKGGGGALLREKIIASRSTEIIAIVDSSKYVQTLGQFPLPVEVTPFGWQTVNEQIKALGAETVLRKKNAEGGAALRRPDEIFVTDNHMYVLDCHFNEIKDPKSLESQINEIPGVVINGLFIGLATRCIIAKGNSIEVFEHP